MAKETHRVQKLLSNYGYCSRRKGEALIEEGRVKVNGEKITIGDKASLTDKITVDDKPVGKQKPVYLMFNKPLACVTALTDKYQKTVMEYIKIKERIFPIGRLDYNTTGLLLFTNDGDFANNVMHPRYEIKKTYLIEIDNPITNADIAKIEYGIELDDGKTSPAKVKKIHPTVLEITIHEGRNRIVRRLFEKLNFRTIKLQRIKIGKLILGTLEEGKSRKLSKKDIEKIFDN